MADRDGSTMGNTEYFEQPNASLDLGNGQLEDLLQQTDIGDDSPGDALAQAQARLTAPIPGAGELLEEEDEKKVFQHILKALKRTQRLRTNRYESAKHWGYVKDGASFSTLEKSEDLSLWKQTFPLDIEQAPQPIPNKVGDVCNKMRNQVLIDVPLPKPIPDGDDDRSRMAADVAKKFLRANGTPDAMNDSDLLYSAFDLMMTQRSSFVYVWVDPMGGGWKPKQMKAHPQATDPKNPMVGPKLGPDNQPIVIQTAKGPQPITERTSDPVLRYVAEDEQGNQTFVKDPSTAARQWMPKLCRKILYASQVQTYPHTTDVFTARHIDIMMWATLGEAKQRFELLNHMSDAQVRTIAKWRPEGLRWETWLPGTLRSKRGNDVESGEIHDDMLVFWITRFCRSDASYMDGGEISVSGANNGTILFRDTLRDDVDLEDGTSVPIVRRPPVSQYKGLNDVVGGDMMGLEPISLFGGANEIYAHLYISILETLHKGLNPNVYIPSTSPVTKEEFTKRDGEPITILVPEDKPTQETVAQLAPESLGVLDRIDHAMNSLAGTDETANGMDSPYAVSGEAKKVAINQAKVGLKQLWHNTMNGQCYYWLICTELAQAKLTVPQQLQLTGIDSAYKQRYFVGSDLVGVTKIAVEPGSGSMMGATEKSQWLALLQQQNWLTPEQAGELARASLSDDLGLASNPHEEAINRQIADWVEGPPDGWDEDYTNNMKMKQQYEATMQQAVASIASMGVDPKTAQQQAMQKVPPPQFKPLYTPFMMRPNDKDPAVAKIKTQKLSRFMSSADYNEATPAWRSIYDDAYNAMFYNAGGQTVEQQAQAAQAAQGAGAGGAGGQDELTFKQFVADVTQKAIAATEGVIAKMITGGGAPNGDAQADPAKVAAIDALATHAGTEAGHAHDAREAQLERAHQAAENAHDRAHELKKTAITESAKQVAKAHDSAQRAALQPRPSPNVSADPAQDPNPSPSPVPQL